MKCETIARMASGLARKCPTQDGAGVRRLHGGEGMLVRGYMRVAVY